MTYPDEFERFYTGNPSAKCTRCGSFGNLFHFAGREDICPFCVISIARQRPLEMLRRLEWSAVTPQGGTVCPDCGFTAARGHENGCGYVAALSGFDDLD